MTVSDQSIQEQLSRWRWSALGLGLLLTAVGFLGLVFDSAHFYRAYLVAWLMLLGLGLGSMVLVMIHHLTGGVWGLVLRRVLEAQMRTLPLIALLFIPVLVGSSHLYPWANDDVRAEMHDFQRTYFQADYVR